MPLERIPAEIAQAVRRLAADHRGWQFAELPRAGGRTVFRLTEKLTAGDCEQAATWHLDKANAAIARFAAGSRPACRVAAAHVLRARWYREIYHRILGMTCEEADMPFPCMTAAQAEQGGDDE
jgi:hypothetical protein